MKQYPLLILLTILTSLLFSQGPVFGYGPLGVDTSGNPLKHPSLSSGSSLTWNAETGPLQDTSVVNRYLNSGDENTSNLNQSAYNALCGGGSPGSGGCSLSPWIKEAQAAAVSNSEGVNLVIQAWNVWQTEATDARVNFGQGSTLGTDVDVCNYTQYLDSVLRDYTISDVNTDSRTCGCAGTCTTSTCLNPIVFDANGDIIAREYGEGNRAAILGSAGPTPSADKSRYIRIEAILNGVCYQGSPDTVSCGSFVLSSDELKTVMTHEFGHAQGLDHVQVNPNSISLTEDAPSSWSATLRSGASADAIPTMYPFLVNNSNNAQATLHKDDKIGLAHLYPKPSAPLLSKYCRATGTIFSGTAGLRCAEVVLRSGGSVTEAISFVSGTEVANNGTPAVNLNTCTAPGTPGNESCGDFVIDGLQPGSTYTIEVHPIPEAFTGGSGMGFCNTNPSFTDISATGSITCPAAGTTLTCEAGANQVQILCRTVQ